MDNDIKVKISAVANGFDSTIGKVQSKLSLLETKAQGIGTKWKNAGEKISNVGKSLAPVSVACGVATGAAVKLGAEYQAQLGKVSAISGATSKEMEILKKTAVDATQGTNFSTIEAAQAYEYMGMAGWKVGDMTKGLTPILNLATAAGADLGTTSDIVTDALTAFGLTAKDAGMFTDVLAAASTNSNTNVQMMGETFKYAAPIAGTLGYTAKDTALAIGMMANAGIKGSMAGTSLRMGLTNLANPGKKAQETLNNLGIQVKDASGKMLPFRDVIGQLREKFKNLSKDQQAQTATALFGKEAMSGWLAIINGSDKDFNKLKNAIDNSNGAAEKMAKTMSDADPIAKAQAQIKNSLIQVGQVLMPIVAKVTDFIAKVAQGFSKLPAPVKTAIVGIVGTLAVLTPILMTVGTLMSSIGTIAGVLGGAVGALSAPFLAVVGAIGSVIAIGILIYKNWDTIKSKAQRLGKALGEVWNGIKQTFSDIWNGIKDVLSGIWEGISNTANNIFKSISDFLSPLFQGIQDIWNTVWAGISEVLNTVWSAITEVGSSVFNGLVEVFNTIWEPISSAWSVVWNGIQNLVLGIWNGICSVAKGVFTPTKKFLEGVWSAISSIWKGVWDGIKAYLTGVWDLFKNTVTTVWNVIKTVINTAWEVIRTITTGIWNGIKNNLSIIWNGIKGIVSNVWNGIKTVISTVWNVIKTLTAGVWGVIKSILTGNFGAIKGIVTDTFNRIKSLISDAWNAIKNTTINVWNTIINTVKNLLNNILNTFKDIFEGIKNAVKKGMDRVKDNISDGIRGAARTIENMIGRFVDIGRDIIYGIANGIKNAAGAVIDAITGAVGGAIDAVKDFAGIHSPSRVFANEVGRWIPEGIAVGIVGNTKGLESSMRDIKNVALDSASDFHSMNILPDMSIDKVDYVKNSDVNINKEYIFNLKLGNRNFRAFARDIEKMNDMELDLIEYS